MSTEELRAEDGAPSSGEAEAYLYRGIDSHLWGEEKKVRGKVREKA